MSVARGTAAARLPYQSPCANGHTVCPLKPRGEGNAMEARFNWIIDSTPIRIAINVAAFAIWFGAAFGLMFFAVHA